MEKKLESKPAPARGLAGMFGAVAPKKAPEPPKKAGGKIKSRAKGTVATMSKPAERKATALALKSSNAKFTVTPSPVEKTEEKTGMDQDVTMGGTGNKKRRRHGFSPYGSRDKARYMQRKENAAVNPVQVLISGFVPGSEMGLVQYLQLKSKKDWQPLNMQVEQGQMLLTVDGPVVANAIIRLNGYVFGTEQLSIQLYQEAKPALSLGTKKETTIDIMREFLLSRWDKQGKFLDLSNMAADPILKRGSIRPPGASNSNAVVGPALMKLAGEMFQDVATISFAHNTLKNVQQISTVTQFLPNVQSISFEGNHMSSLENLEAISGTGKLKSLRELVLLNNPLREKEISHGGERKYIRNVLKRFPFLNVLDGAPIQLTEEDQQAILRTRKVLPLDSRPSFFDNEQNQNIAWEFLQKYLHLFDNDRNNLQPLYSESSTFSLSSSLKLRSVQKVKRRQKQRMMQDDAERLSWKEVSRNLGKGKSSNAGKHLYCGQAPIFETLARLPNTIHDLSHTQDFLVDAFQLSPQIMQISVHGEFKEASELPPYSFDRTFLLRPAEPGSPATAAGWPFIITSDILCVRDYRALN